MTKKKKKGTRTHLTPGPGKIARSNRFEMRYSLLGTEKAYFLMKLTSYNTSAATNSIPKVLPRHLFYAFFFIFTFVCLFVVFVLQIIRCPWGMESYKMVWR